MPADGTLAAITPITPAEVSASLPRQMRQLGQSATVIYDKQVRDTYLIVFSYQDDFYLMPSRHVADRYRAPRARLAAGFRAGAKLM